MEFLGLTRARHSPILRPMLNFRLGLARLARRMLFLGVAALLTTRAMAAPDSAPSAPATAAPAADAISRYLIDKGLIAAAPAGSPTTDNAFVERVRSKASDMVLTAMNFLGVPYRRGGNSAEHGFDCSGFTRQVFELSLGLLLPRRVDEQAHAAGLVAVKRNDLEPGDLVFFNTLRRTFSHVGIYLGDGKFIHAPRPGGEVRVEDMRFAYWAKRFTGARRAEPALERATPDRPSAAPAMMSAPVQAVR
jgi:cell wall-associated NlpC family hydrolase